MEPGADVKQEKQELLDGPSDLQSLVNKIFEAMCEGDGHPQEWLEKRPKGFEVEAVEAFTSVGEVDFICQSSTDVDTHHFDACNIVVRLCS